MNRVKIDYRKLNARQQEIYNFQIAASYLAGYGFNCIKLADDWQGADFLAYHIDGENTLKVQLKSRPTVKKAYMGEAKNLYMCFPIENKWFLIKHDELFEIANRNKMLEQTLSWTRDGFYTFPKPNREMVHELHEFILDAPNYELSSE